MIDVALLSVIRRWHLREGMPIREIARRTGLSRNTVRKYLASGVVEPSYPKRKSPSMRAAFIVLTKAPAKRAMTGGTIWRWYNASPVRCATAHRLPNYPAALNGYSRCCSNVPVAIGRWSISSPWYCITTNRKSNRPLILHCAVAMVLSS